MKNSYSPTRHFTRQHPLITGTLLLTAAGFLSRFIGFFYRIYLSRVFGEEGMGIYQLIHPISALTFSLTAAALQTVVSKFVAAQTTPSHKYKPLFLCAGISLPLSVLTSVLLFFGASPIATYYLAEPRTEILIQLLSFTVPFSAAHACINGFFYGIQRASVPAGTQFLEQICRVGSVYLLSAYLHTCGQTPNLSVIVIGLIVGEAAGLMGAVFSFKKVCKKDSPFHDESPSPVTYRALLSMIIPLMANRVFLNTLQSLEAVSLPARLQAYGYDRSTSLRVYGVLTGMAFPLIFFPNALTGSVSVVLLPNISENMAKNRKREVKKTITQTIQYCSILGFFCMGIFLFFGRAIGIYAFQSELAGYFISELSFLCPFLYLNSTLSGILQGLGKAGALFFCNITALLIRLLMIYTAVPIFGMQGYLWGVLISQILLTAFCLFFIMISFKKSRKTNSNLTKKLAPSCGK